MKTPFNKNKLSIIVPIIFIILTFFCSIKRIPFFDEAHSYIIAQFKLWQIFYMTRIEGHPMLWYLLIKAFTFNQKFYPYPILVLNWIISSIMILFFWFKLPFNKIQKTLIIFSCPFLGYFAIVARPYSLTILSLFLLTYFLNKKNPILFSFLLLFAMNTTVMGMIGAFCFGILFVYKLIKEKNITKKQLLTIVSVFIFEIIIFFLQFYLTKKPEFENYNILMSDFKTGLCSYILNPLLSYKSDTVLKILFKIVVFILFWYSSIIFFIKSKKAFFYFILSNTMLTLLFLNVYIGWTWHYYFYYINYFIALSICYDKIKCDKVYNIFVYLFLFLFLTPYSVLKNGKIGALNTYNYPLIVKDIVDFNKSDNTKKYYCFDNYGYINAILPYLKSQGIKVYDMFGNERTQFKSLVLLAENKDYSLIPEEILYKIQNEDNSYLLARMPHIKDGNHYSKTITYKRNNCTLMFNLGFEDVKNEYAIYKIKVKCSEK